MSKIADDIYSGIKILFPYETIIPEYFVNYRNNRLFFDFFIKSLNICIECQGRQHFQFIKHFHGDKEKFYEQKRRDNLKLEYCLDNDLAHFPIGILPNHASSDFTGRQAKDKYLSFLNGTALNNVSNNSTCFVR